MRNKMASYQWLKPWPKGYWWVIFHLVALRFDVIYNNRIVVLSSRCWRVAVNDIRHCGGACYGVLQCKLRFLHLFVFQQLVMITPYLYWWMMVVQAQQAWYHRKKIIFIFLMFVLIASFPKYLIGVFELVVCDVPPLQKIRSVKFGYSHIKLLIPSSKLIQSCRQCSWKIKDALMLASVFSGTLNKNDTWKSIANVVILQKTVTLEEVNYFG
jgi:hypothetical protein